MIRSFILSALLLANLVVVAQTDYLVTHLSDTIKGSIHIMSYDNIDRVQVNIEKGKKKSFSSLDVRLVSLEGNFYKPVKMDKSIRMMRVIKGGYLSLYAYRLNNQTTYDGRFLAKLDGTSMDMPNLTFKKVLADYLGDCENISTDIKQGTLGRKDIEEIVDRYNTCVLKPKGTDQKTVEKSPELKERVQAIQELSGKVKKLDFDTKQDALDILRDMQSKVERNENVQRYQIEGLQSALQNQPSLQEELSKLVALFKK